MSEQTCRLVGAGRMGWAGKTGRTERRNGNWRIPPSLGVSADPNRATQNSCCPRCMQKWRRTRHTSHRLPKFAAIDPLIAVFAHRAAKLTSSYFLAPRFRFTQLENLSCSTRQFRFRALADASTVGSSVRHLANSRQVFAQRSSRFSPKLLPSRCDWQSKHSARFQTSRQVFATLTFECAKLKFGKHRFLDSSGLHRSGR